MENIQILVLCEPKLIFQQTHLVDSLILLFFSYFNKKSELHQQTTEKKSFFSFKGR